MFRYTVPVIICWAVPAAAQVVSYEANSFPEETGPWVHSPEVYPAERFIEDGWLVQVAEIIENGGEERDRYTRDISEFASVQSLFLEWILLADGPSEAIPAVAPSSIVIGEQIGDIYYHFTIAEDQARFIQDVTFPFVWADLTPGTAHLHRLELLGTQEFRWLVDGQLIHSGKPEGPYPTDDAVISFRCAAASVETETVCSWASVRFGVIPSPASGDFDSRGSVDWFDFYYFQECLTSPSGSWAGCAWADMDQDFDTDCDDWGLFQAAWTAPENPPIVIECVCGLADLNASNAVEANDLAMLLGAWGPNSAGDADLTNDGMVNASDLALLLGAWGPCP